MVKDLVVTRSVMLQAPPARVWEVLTDPAMTKEYMNECSIATSWQIGEPLEWKNKEDKVRYRGQLLEIVPGSKLMYSYFDPHAGSEDEPSSYVHVTYTVVPRNGITELLVTLTNFGGNDTRAEHAASNWDFEILPRLKALAESRTMAVMR
jgi:uncharacterized protein YndB with AHSA1/START domain